MEKKKQLILQSANQLFFKHGFKRVTIEEVCRLSQVSKMTFYRHFQDKHDLAKTVFDEMVNDGFEKFRQLLDKAVSADQFVQSLLRLKLETTEHISQEFLADFYSDNGSDLKEYVNRKTTEKWAEVIELFKVAQEKGLISSDIDPHFFFQVAMKVSELLTDKQYLKNFENPQEMIKALSILLTNGIVPGERNIRKNSKKQK